MLAQRRFQPTSVPTPLRCVRERIGDGLRRLGRPLEDAFSWVAGWLPGGSSLLWVLLAGAVLAAAAALAMRAGRARRLAGAGAAAGDAAGERRSAAQLIREAERAERAGDLDAALRLRFRAGLIELDSRELIELRPALTNRELLRDVPSPTLAGLVDGFESVAYGGRPAAARRRPQRARRLAAGPGGGEHAMTRAPRQRRNACAAAALGVGGVAR